MADSADLMRKLLRLAVDGAATDAEADNAATQAIRVARRLQWDYRTLCREISQGLAVPATALVPRPGPAPSRRTPIWIYTTRMPFGKHKGETISDIMKEDPSYVIWIHGKMDTLRGFDLKEAIAEAHAILVANER